MTTLIALYAWVWVIAAVVLGPYALRTGKRQAAAARGNPLEVLAAVNTIHGGTALLSSILIPLPYLCWFHLLR